MDRVFERSGPALTATEREHMNENRLAWMEGCPADAHCAGTLIFLAPVVHGRILETGPAERYIVVERVDDTFFRGQVPEELLTHGHILREDVVHLLDDPTLAASYIRGFVFLNDPAWALEAARTLCHHAGGTNCSASMQMPSHDIPV